MEAKTHVIIPEKEAKNHVIKEEDEHFHVLAVDDSVIERKMLEKLLTISSFHVTCVESGDKALEYLGLMNCHTPSVLAGSDVDPHHHHHDGADNIHDDDDDDDDNSDDEHDDDGGGGDGDSMIFPSIPLANAHKQQEGQGTRVNLIMTDYSMPGMSGYDLLKRVKESSWKDVPVVVMSSENVPSRIHMCLEEGAEEFLLKPVRLSDLKKLQPHILKFTSTATAKKTNPNFASNDDDHNKISNEAITAITEEKRNNEDFITNSNEVKLKDEFQFRVDTENFAKILKLEQL